MRIETGDGWTMYQGDCLDVLPTLAGVDAVVTDPPYGLGRRMTAGDGSVWSKHWRVSPSWDNTTSPGVVQLVNYSYVIIWGGNYYPLPPSRGWLVWDKMQEHTSGHAELAWTNLDQPIRTFRMSRVKAYGLMNKQHPTQKPEALIRWCLSFLPPGALVLDPFAGSGTTGVACIQTGRRFIGVEIDPGYFDIAVRRLRQAEEARQPSLLEAVGD